jgi:hypothetical protein
MGSVDLVQTKGLGLAKVRVARAFEGAQPVRLQFVHHQMRCTEPSEMPTALP